MKIGQAIKQMLIPLVMCFPSYGFIEPYINVTQIIDYGELLPLTGICHIDHDTKEVIDIAGNVCPYPDTRYGEPGRYMLVGNPNTNMSIKIASRLNPGDGMSFAPDGIYQVNGRADIAIVADQFQTVNTGDTGVITIIIGGSLTIHSNLSFNNSYRVDIAQGIVFNELP
ncbi:hypothetical protein [Thalassotalea ganghwensis]